MMRLLTSELMKLRRSGVVWIAVLAPLFLVLQGVANFMRYRDSAFANSRRTEWEILYEQCIILYPSLLLPLVITILMALLARIEHGQNGWKQLLALPVTRAQVYVSKLIIACLLVFLNLSVLSAGTLLAGLAVGAEGAVPYGLLLGRGLLAFIAVLPVMTYFGPSMEKFEQDTVMYGIAAALFALFLLLGFREFRKRDMM
jgi:hypothetical protein